MGRKRIKKGGQDGRLYESHVPKMGISQNAVRRRKAKALAADGPSDFQRKVNGLTNWQRKQWAKAGSPVGRIDEFLAMTRDER